MTAVYAQSDIPKIRTSINKFNNILVLPFSLPWHYIAKYTGYQFDSRIFHLRGKVLYSCIYIPPRFTTCCVYAWYCGIIRTKKSCPICFEHNNNTYVHDYIELANCLCTTCGSLAGNLIHFVGYEKRKTLMRYSTDFGWVSTLFGFDRFRVSKLCRNWSNQLMILTIRKLTSSIFVEIEQR